MNFAQVETEYRRLKAQVAAGQLSEDEFKAKLQELMIQDEQGRWWVIGLETGQWYVHDGEAWVPAQPPAPASAPEVSAVGARTEPVASPPVAPPAQKQPAAPSGRKPWPWIALALLVVGILAVLALRLLASQEAEPEVALLLTQEPTVVADASAAALPTATFAATAAPREEAPPTPTGETAATATAEASLKAQAAAQAQAATATAEAATAEALATAGAATAEAAVAPTETDTIEPTALPTDTPEPTAAPAPTPTAAPQPTATIAPRPTTAPLPTRAPPAVTTQPGMIFNSEAEDFGAWRRGDEPYGSFTPSSEQKHSGSYAGKLSYDFPAVQNNYVVFLRPAPLRIPEQPDALTLWVFGDGSNHFLNAWIRDAQGEVRQFTFGQVSHKDSWQPMTLRLDTTAPWPQGHISGPDNGQLDYPISLEALVLDGVPDGAASKGVLYLDDLMVGQRPG